MQTTSVMTITMPDLANAVAVTAPTGMSLRAIQPPAAMEGTSFTFEAGSTSPGAPLYDGAAIYSQPCAANRYIPITKPELFIGLSYLKLTTAASGSPVNQGADRTLTLFFASE
jgi:hypothetical protein